jgi:hypothetical protein
MITRVNSGLVNKNPATATKFGYWLPAVTTTLWSLVALNKLSAVNSLPLLRHTDYLLGDRPANLKTTNRRGKGPGTLNQTRNRHQLQARATQIHAVLSHVDLLDDLEPPSRDCVPVCADALRKYAAEHQSLIDVCTSEYRTRLSVLGSKSKKTGESLDRLGIASHATRLLKVLTEVFPDLQREVIVEGRGGPYVSSPPVYSHHPRSLPPICCMGC